MYCKSCGAFIESAAAPSVYGAGAYTAGLFRCRVCGGKIISGADICIGCGATVVHGAGHGAKSKLAAGLLGVCLGAVGAHNFYLGYTGKAALQVFLLMIFAIFMGRSIIYGIGFITVFVWGVAEGIMILAGKIATDVNGDALKGRMPA